MKPTKLPPLAAMKEVARFGQRTPVTAWLRCRLDVGMFSDEVAVTYPADSCDTWQKSVFVPSACVRYDTEHQGEVRVNLVIRVGCSYAVLPSARRDIVSVNDADLRWAAP